MKKIALIMMILACLLFVGCNKDGETEETTAATTAVDPNHVHEWGDVEVIEAPTCRFVGEGVKKCECGAEETVEIPALDHVVPTSEYVNVPTFTREGVQAGICTRCEKKIRSTAPNLQKKYVDVEANLDKISNVYFNGFWADTDKGAYTNMLGSEVIAKVTGASKVTYTFESSDNTQSAFVAYTTDGITWTRHNIAYSATLEVDVPAEATVLRVMFVETSIDLTAENAGIILKSVSADNGTVTPCTKDGVTALVISDNVTDIESDVFTLASESLGFTAYRISREGLGYEELPALLAAYAQTTAKTTKAAPDYIMISLGENDADLAGSTFMTALSDVVNIFVDAYPETDIMLIKPESGAKSGMIDTITAFHGVVSAIDTTKWATAANVNVKALLLEELLVDTYGEKVYFDGYYEEYSDPQTPGIPNDKTNDGSFGELKPMEKV